MKKLSVIVPVYNTRAYLEKCLDSIIQQECSGFEVIVVDDCSTDGSYEICQEYGQKYPAQVHVHQTSGHRGPGGARNIGIHASNGDYIAFVDSDDFIYPNAYNTLLKVAELEDADVVMFSNHVVDHTGKVLWEKQYPYSRYPSNREAIIGDVYNTVSWNKLWRSSLIKNSKLLYPEEIRYQDYSVIPIWLGLADRIVYADTPFYAYLFVRQDNITNAPVSMQSLDILTASDYLIKNLQYVPRYEMEVYYLIYRHITGQISNWENKELFVDLEQIVTKAEQYLLALSAKVQNNPYVQCKALEDEKMTLLQEQEAMKRAYSIVLSQNEVLQNQNTVLSKELKDMYLSRSWRTTKPLRYCFKIIKRLLGES